MSFFWNTVGATVPTGWVGNWLLNNLVSYYKADTSGSFPDAHWSNDLTSNGVTYTATWKINGAYDYDWVNDTMSQATTSTLWLANSFSFFTWVKSDSWGTYNYVTIARNYAININNLFTMYFENGKISVDLYSNAQVLFKRYTKTTSEATGTYLHIWFTWNWTDLKLYVNNVEATVTKITDISGTMADTTRKLYLWSNVNVNSYFNWIIDETWYWGRSLTTDNISDLYNSWSWLGYSSFTS